MDQVSPLLAHMGVIVPGLGTWVQCRHVLIYGAILGVEDIGAGTGVTLGTAGVCGLGVAGIAGATGGGCGSCAGLAGAGNVTKMCGLAGACSVAGVTAGVVSVGLTLCS